MASTAPDRDRNWPPVSYWWKVAAGILAVYALARMIVAVRQILILILVSLILAIGFQPTIAWLERKGLKRGQAVAAMTLVALLVVGGFLALMVPTIITQIAQLIDKAPDYLRRAQHENGFVADLNTRFDLAGKLHSAAASAPSTVLSLFKSFTALIFNTLTVVILTLYFTSALPTLRAGIARLLTPHERSSFESILEESTQRVGGYIMGNLLISLIAGIAAFAALLVIRVPYAAALGFWVALTDLIPTVGAILGALAAVIVAAFAGVPQLVATIVYFIVYQQVENYVISPRVMRKAIEMSAAAVIVAVLIGGSLAGFVGALLALPAAAMIKIAVRQLYIEERLEELSAQPS
jgi:predicted PurR-regulated permease PerM